MKTLRDKRKEIVQFAELDDIRWEELIRIIEKQDKEFICQLKEDIWKGKTVYSKANNQNIQLSELFERMFGSSKAWGTQWS